MPIPTEPVGSMPRFPYLLQALNDFADGRIRREKLEEMRNHAVYDTLFIMRVTGQTLVTDGNMRIGSFMTYPFADLVADKLEEGSIQPGQYTPYACLSNGTMRFLPIVQSKFKYRNYAYEQIRQSAPLLPNYEHRLRANVVSPSLLFLLYPRHNPLPDYSIRAFEDDLVKECIHDIRGCFAFGAARVVIDAPELTLSIAAHPAVPWTLDGLLPFFIRLINRVLSDFPPDVRRNIGIHTCIGADLGCNYLPKQLFMHLIPSLISLNAGYFLLPSSFYTIDELSSIASQLKHGRRAQPDGLESMFYFGVTDPIKPEVESVDEVATILTTVGRILGPDRIGATDDCGFCPFVGDPKTALGGVTNAIEIARQKMRNRVLGAKLASVRLGI